MAKKRDFFEATSEPAKVLSALKQASPAKLKQIQAEKFITYYEFKPKNQLKFSKVLADIPKKKDVAGKP